MTITRLTPLIAAIVIAGCGGSSAVNPPQTTTRVVTTAQSPTTAGAASPSTNGAHSNPNHAAAQSGAVPRVSGTDPAQTATGATTAARGATTTGNVSTTKNGAHSSHNPAPARNQNQNLIRAATHQSAVSPVSGAKPAVGFMANCMSNAGLGDVQLLRPNEWRGVVALRVKPVYIDGPYSSTSQAEAAANSLLGIESVSAGGLYVVSAVLADHLDPYVNAIAKCLAAAGNAPSGQHPISG